MKKDLFIKKLKHRGTVIINTADTPILHDFRALKEFFKYIDFGCKINSKTGGCKDTPDRRSCCCSDCLYSVGYFKTMLERDIGRYSKIFSTKTGFLRKGKGCILPHMMRSTTCLTHHCHQGGYHHPYFEKDDKYKDFSRGMMEIKQRLIQIRESIK